MRPDEWAQVKALFEAALEMPGADRERFLIAAREFLDGIELQRYRPAPPLPALPSPRLVDHDAPHHTRRNREEMRAVLPIDVTLIHEPDVRLMDQRRRRQRAIAALACQMFRCNRP